MPHLLPLSETVLRFKGQITFLGGLEIFIVTIALLRLKARIIKIIVEVNTL